MQVGSIVVFLTTLVISTNCHSHSKRANSGVVFPQSWFPRWIWPSEDSNNNDHIEIVDNGESSNSNYDQHVSETVLEECLRSEMRLNTNLHTIRSKVEFPPTVIDVGDNEEEEEEEPFIPCGEGDVDVYSGDVHAFRSQGYPERPVSRSRRRPSMCRWDFMVQPGVAVDLMCADFDAFCNQRSALYAKVSGADARTPSFTRFTRRFYWSRVCRNERLTNTRIRINTSRDTFRLSLVGYHRARFSCVIVGNGGTERPGGEGEEEEEEEGSEEGEGEEEGGSDNESNNNSTSVECGTNSLAFNSLIIRGTEAKQGEFPWMVLLIIQRFTSCGASLISNRWILTAAHCTVGATASQILAYIGCHRRDRSDCAVGRSIVDKNIRHANYNGNTLTNDIALLRLAKEVTLGPRVRPVCLPSSPVPTPGHPMEVAGWGRTLSGGLPTVLMKAKMESVTDARCREFYGFGLSSNVLCSLEVSGAVCNGDSGGCLGSVNANGKIQQDGVVSFGSIQGCGVKNIPDGFTEVYRFLKWIRENMQ